MLSFFERLVDPYPDQPESVPTPQLWPFILHYSRPFAGLLLSMALVTALVSAAEVVFFTAMGELVDWLAEADREGFVDTHLTSLIGLGAAVLAGLPLLVFLLKTTT